MFCFKRISMAVAACIGATSAEAQNFTGAYVFGDSTVDSGFYRALPNPGGGNFFNNNWAAAVAAGAGAPTSRPGLMNSEVLANYFGLSALPANQAGGTNYATSGAKNVLVNNAQTGGFTRAIPTLQQFQNYLAANGGQANANGIYLINSGSNDLAFAAGDAGVGPFPINATAFAIASAQSLATGIAGLQAAGARTIIVSGTNYSFGDAAAQQLRLDYVKALWSSLAAQGVNFIPSDFNAVRLAIQADRARFGFQFISTNDQQTACVRPNPAVGNAYALLCSNAPGAPSQFANPTADQTRLFADAEGHLSTAGQKLVADYNYSLVVAPSQISMLAENAVKVRTARHDSIQRQIEATQVNQGSSPFNVWATGDVSRVKIDNYEGFPDDPSNIGSLSSGASYRVAPGMIIGGAISTSRNSPAWSGGRGGFTEDEITGSVFGAYRGTSAWGTLVGSYGKLDYGVDRIIPMGITSFANTAETNGRNWSVGGQAGYDYRVGAVKTGPVAGLLWQRVEVDGFTETATEALGSFTSLTFGAQKRESVVGTLGWRAGFEAGAWKPFAQAVWNRELASTGRSITTTLTSASFAPSYSMPSVALDKDWGTVTLGTTLQLAEGVVAFGSVQSDFAGKDSNTYGAQLGVNFRF